MNRRELLTASKPRFTPHRASPGARRFTNARLRTHENQQVRFYDDLIRGRQSVTQFMYADCNGACPLVTTSMLKVYKALQDRMGRDVFFYSITIKPETDDPAALKQYAQMHQADLPGWTFLTGDPFDIQTIRFRLFRMNHPGVDLDPNTHASTLRIVNDATNCWFTAHARAGTESILKHIAWADPPKSRERRLLENRQLQIKIDKDVERYGYRRTV